MSLIDKLSRPTGGGLDPLLDSTLPAWKKDLILKKRAMHRTFPFHLSSIPPPEFGRTKHLADGDDRVAVSTSAHPTIHAWRSTEGSGACKKPQALGREPSAGDGGDATHAFHDKNMVEEQVSANNIDGGLSRLELTSRSESTSPSLHGGSQQSLVYDPESASESEEEYEYGPGIVNRLRSKFISLTRRDGFCGPTTPPPPPQPSYLPVRRVASMEHLLDEPFSSSGHSLPPSRRGDWNKASLRGSGSLANSHPTTEVMKRARSMETLSAIDRGPVGSHLFLPRFMYRGYSRDEGPPLSPVNDNVIIIEQPKPQPANSCHSSGLRLAQDGGTRKGTSLSHLDEDEFPKPDTVRTCKKIFEHSTGDSSFNGVPVVTNNASVKRKVAPPPKPPGLKPGPKPVFARRMVSPACTKPVFKLLEQNDVREDGSTAPVEIAAGEGPDPSADAGSGLTNGVVVVVTEVPENLPDSVERSESKLPVQVDALESCAKRSDSHDNAIPNLPREPSPTADRVSVEAEDEEAVEGCNKPKVVSFQPKSEEKDRPVGHIRPFHTVEQNSASGGGVRDETDSIPNGSDAPAAYAFPPKKPIPPSSQGLVSQIFNFIGKQVQPHISNNATPFDFRRRPIRQVDRVNSTNVENLAPHSNGAGSSYYIVGDGGNFSGSADDYSDEEDGDDSLADLVSVSKIAFIGDNIIVGRSALIKTRNKKLKIAFDDQALSTYEYPSENSLLDNEAYTGGIPDIELDQTYTPIKSQDALRSNPGIGSSSDLGSYKPMSVDTTQVFKLGEMPAPHASVTNRANQSAAKEEVMEEDLFLKPAPDDQNQVWSSAETSDMLF